MHRAAPAHRWLLAILLLLLVLLAGCAGVPRSIEIPRQQLEAALVQRFPSEVRPAGFPLATVARPRLDLLPDENRLRVQFLVDLAERVLRSPARGEISLRFGLRYEPADATVRATDVRVEDIDLQGLPEGLRRPLRLTGAWVAEQLLEDVVLHRLDAEDLARARGWTPGAIQVTPRGVRVELRPPA